MSYKKQSILNIGTVNLSIHALFVGASSSFANCTSFEGTPIVPKDLS